MEGITWLTHKYVMHGFLWYLHEDHHQPKYQGMFERNDAFFVIFAIPSILLFYYGVTPTLNVLFFIALGILFSAWGYTGIFANRLLNIFDRRSSESNETFTPK